MAKSTSMRIGLEPITLKESQMLDLKSLGRTIINILDMCSEGARIDFNVTTQTWVKRPTFHISRRNTAERSIYTTDIIYHYLAGGTRPHEIIATGKSQRRRETIRPKVRKTKKVKAKIIPPIVPVPQPEIEGGPRLAFFRTGFRPKSKVGKIASYKGKMANRDFVMPKKVNHPGTEARKWDRIIRDKWKKQLPVLTMRAIQTEVRRIRTKA
jgi:hypothetical protein